MTEFVEQEQQPVFAARGKRTTTLWHSQANMAAVKDNESVIVKGDGAYVWDAEGNRLLDAPASLWFCNVGHGRREIGEAVVAQMGEIEAYHSFQQFTTKPTIELAERVAALAPIDNAKVFFTSGGSDSIDAAAKLARRYWAAVGRPEKQLIISRTGCYHGLHGFGTSIAGLEFNREGFGELVPDTARVATNDAAALEALIKERGADQVAAFIAEPVIGTGGVIAPADGYFAEVRRICSENDVLLVADEVITGFGRVGEMFASERFDIRPDMIAMAKGITSGYQPLGGLCISEPIWEPFWRDGSDLIFRHGITYSGHATACAAAAVNLDILEAEELPARVRTLESVLDDALRPLTAHDLVVEVRAGVGLLAGVQVVDDAVGAAVCDHCIENGVLTRMLPGSTIHISPPLIIDEGDVDFLVETLSVALDAAA